MTNKDLKYLIKQAKQNEEEKKLQYYNQQEIDDIKNIARLEDLIVEHYKNNTSNVITIDSTERFYYYNDRVIKKCCDFKYMFIDNKKTKSRHNYLVLNPTIIQYMKYFYWNFNKKIYWTTVFFLLLFVINILEFGDSFLGIHVTYIVLSILSIINLYITRKIQGEDIGILLEKH